MGKRIVKKPIPYTLIDCEPNRSSTEEADDVLKASIALNGLLQPVVLRETDGGKFKVLAGRRRFAALKSLYPPSAELMPEQYTFAADEAADDVIAATENLARLDMTAREKVNAALALRKAYPETPLKRLATACGCGIQTFKNRLKVGALPKKFLDLLDDGLPLCKLEKFAALPEAVRDAAAPDELFDGEVQGFQLPEGGLCGECAACPWCSWNADPDLFSGQEPGLCYRYTCYKDRLDERHAALIRAEREKDPELLVVTESYLSEAQAGVWAWGSHALESYVSVPDNAAEYEEKEVLYLPDEGEPERRRMHFRPVDIYKPSAPAPEPVKEDPAEALKRKLAAEEAAYFSQLDRTARKLVKARYRTIADFPEFTFEKIAGKMGAFRLVVPEYHLPVLNISWEEFNEKRMYEKGNADPWFIPLFALDVDRKGLEVLPLYNIDKQAWLDTAKMTCHPSKNLIGLREQAKEMGL